MKNNKKDIFSLVLSMIIFGTIGLFRKFIPLPSSLLACVRGAGGALFLVFFVLVIKKSRFSGADIKKNLAKLLVSGALIGVNWILLFESYNYTSVAVATLCYYMAPVFVVIASPFVLREKLTLKKIITVIIALTGMAFVSGIAPAGFDISGLKGIAFGFGAAIVYASVILINKTIIGVGAFDKTVVQLSAASIAVLPYVLFTTDFSCLLLTNVQIVLTVVVCILHTGIAYALYFGSMEKLKAHTIAMFSYLDPVVALVLSQLVAIILPALLPEEEPLTLAGAIGAVAVLGSAAAGEINFSQVIKNVRNR